MRTYNMVSLPNSYEFPCQLVSNCALTMIKSLDGFLETPTHVTVFHNLSRHQGHKMAVAKSEVSYLILQLRQVSARFQPLCVRFCVANIVQQRNTRRPPNRKLLKTCSIFMLSIDVGVCFWYTVSGKLRTCVHSLDFRLYVF